MLQSSRKLWHAQVRQFLTFVFWDFTISSCMYFCDKLPFFSKARWLNHLQIPHEMYIDAACFSECHIKPQNSDWFQQLQSGYFIYRNSEYLAPFRWYEALLFSCKISGKDVISFTSESFHGNSPSFFFKMRGLKKCFISFFFFWKVAYISEWRWTTHRQN
jgi:hypothetical protein